MTTWTYALDKTYPTHENSDYTLDTTYSVFPTVYTHTHARIYIYTHTHTHRHARRCRWQRGVKTSACCHSFATTAGLNPAGGMHVCPMCMLSIEKISSNNFLKSINRQDFVMETIVHYLGECERLKALTSKTMSTTEFCDLTPSSVVAYRFLYRRVLKIVSKFAPGIPEGNKPHYSDEFNASNGVLRIFYSIFIHSRVTWWTNKCTFINVFNHMQLFFTNIFRSLLWPSAGRRITKTQLVYK